jgi:hypothetical protein
LPGVCIEIERRTEPIAVWLDPGLTVCGDRLSYFSDKAFGKNRKALPPYPVV